MASGGMKKRSSSTRGRAAQASKAKWTGGSVLALAVLAGGSWSTLSQEAREWVKLLFDIQKDWPPVEPPTPPAPPPPPPVPTPPSPPDPGHRIRIVVDPGNRVVINSPVPITLQFDQKSRLQIDIPPPQPVPPPPPPPPSAQPEPPPGPVFQGSSDDHVEAGEGESEGGVGFELLPGSRGDFLAAVGLDNDRVFFDTNRYDLDDRDRATLDLQAAWLQRNPAVRVTIEGHADERGTRDYNLALGDRRANAARDYLAARGVSPARITVISYGKERPQALGSHEAAWAQNRRAVTVLSE